MKYTILILTLAVVAFVAVSWANINNIYQMSEDGTISSTVTIIDEIASMPGHIDDYWVWKSDGDIGSLLLYQFMHGSVFHILGNMMMLLMFGIVIESRIQSRIIPLLLIAGVVGGVSHTALSGFGLPNVIFESVGEQLPLVGASQDDVTGIAGLVGMSGSISGLVGAYLVFFPSLGNGFRILVIWLVGMNIVPLLFWSDNISYEAHIGGFVAGIIIGVIMKKIESRGQRVIGPGPNDNSASPMDKTLHFGHAGDPGVQVSQAGSADDTFRQPIQ